MGILTDAVEESSGLSCSLSMVGVCYTHNDSQDKARIFAVDTTGKLLAEIRLKGVRARDWEDIAIAGNYLYIGDIGDNRARKTSKKIHRIKEPYVLNVSLGEIMYVDAETFEFDMPAEYGAQNAESMFCEPRGETLYIITKKPDKGETDTAQGKWILKLKWGDRSSPEYVGHLWDGLRGNRKVTGAEMSSDGSLVAVRTYTHIYVWKVSTHAPQKVMERRPCGSRYFKEKQSEAIGFSADGRKLYTTSWGAVGGSSLSMWEYTVGGSSDKSRGGSRSHAAKKLDSSPGKDGRGKPLSECQGDCDRNSDCADEMVCFQRDGHTSVPGCSGRGVKNFDYCIRK